MSAALHPAPGGRAAWRERWLNWRNGLVADPRFQRWAAVSPFTRFIAQRRAKALFDLCAGFVYSQILLACVRLRLFETLAAGPQDVNEIASRLALSPEAAHRLLRAAASLRLLRALPNDRFALDDLGASMLGNPSVAAFVEHHTLLYDDLRDPVALLRGETTTRLSDFWPYAKGAAGDEAACGAYSELMARSQKLIAQDVLDAYPLGRHRCLLDIGGGEGAFVAAVAASASGAAAAALRSAAGGCAGAPPACVARAVAGRNPRRQLSRYAAAPRRRRRHAHSRAA